ncbi:MAG: NAD(P)H-dependent oxidoreductase [Marivita lacus]|nr:NAD(P)H-dependent oxidoreductase [Marivita lacus]
MPTTLVVLAHPERRSFNGAWSDATETAARAQGDRVLRSDLCQMGFDPVEGVHHYTDWPEKTAFDPLKAQERAAGTGTTPSDVQVEVDKIKQADRLVLHFPLWWFAPPAILKGWFDRAFQHGALHDTNMRFDSGTRRGKQALMCVTTGSNASESAHDGKEGDINLLLWPTAYTLRYLGFDVLEPVVVHGVHGYHRGDRKVHLTERLNAALLAQAGVLAGLGTRPRLPFNADTDFDQNGQLRCDKPSVTPFIRHRAAFDP